jgi:hypothetical protein
MLKRSLLFLLCAVCLVAIPAAFIVMRSPRSVSFEGQIADYPNLMADGNLSLLAQALPSSARQISYKVRPYARTVCADFAISKQEFLEWATTRGWKPNEIDYARVVNACQIDPKPVSVEKGLYYTEKRFKLDKPRILLSELLVVFDADTSCCYYRFSR